MVEEECDDIMHEADDDGEDSLMSDAASPLEEEQLQEHRVSELFPRWPTPELSSAY